MSRTEVGIIVRHTKTQQTGATVVTEKVGPGSWIEEEPGWMTLCLNHGQLIFHETRTLAEWHHSDPGGWCSDCRRIKQGVMPKLTEKVY